MHYEKISLEGADIILSKACFNTNDKISGDYFRDKPSLNMFFNLNGIQGAVDYNTGKTCQYIKGQHAISYDTISHGNYSVHSSLTEDVSISLYETFYQKILDEDIPFLDNLKNNISKGRAYELSSTPVIITPDQKLILNQIKFCPYSGSVKRMFLEAKIIELLLLQLEQIKSSTTILDKVSAQDRERLYAVREYIQNHIFEHFTLRFLSLEVGLNEFKLKTGFKNLFGTTVFGYVTDLRMNHARQMLLEPHCRISDVAYNVGYTDAYAFSRAFKKHFGYLPSELK